jgi:hypothetical protein
LTAIEFINENTEENCTHPLKAWPRLENTEISHSAKNMTGNTRKQTNAGLGERNIERVIEAEKAKEEALRNKG